MIMKKFLFALAISGSILLINTEVFAKGRGDGPIVYVTSQDLAYDSIVLTDLPYKGKFQKLEMAGPTGLQTEFGPGDQEFVGGRWWVDANPNGIMDKDDHYFLCPLLGPGREIN